MKKRLQFLLELPSQDVTTYVDYFLALNEKPNAWSRAQKLVSKDTFEAELACAKEFKKFIERTKWSL